MNHKIKIYWCDDEFASKVLNPVNEDYLQENDIEVQPFSKSDDLLTALNRHNIENHVDAVIFDFNMSNISGGRPEIDEKSGFLEILRNMKNYIEKGIPFFLWSKMDSDYIRSSISQSSDYKKELLIFDSYINEQGLKIDGHDHKRQFAGEDFEELIDSVIREVKFNKTPQAMLRRKYPEAYEAAMSVERKCWDDIVNVLTLTPESDDWHRMEDLINPLRCHVENTMKRLGIPAYNGKISLNSLGKFISGQHQDFSIHPNLVDVALGYGISHLMQFLQDGSHQHEILKQNIRLYLIEKKDEHLLYYIAHSFINLLIWANKALLIKEDVGDICFPNEKIRYDQNTSNKLEVDESGNLHIGDCQITNFVVGRRYSIIQKISNNGKKYKYYSIKIEPVDN